MQAARLAVHPGPGCQYEGNGKRPQEHHQNGPDSRSFQGAALGNEEANESRQRPDRGRQVFSHHALQMRLARQENHADMKMRASQWQIGHLQGNAPLSTFFSAILKTEAHSTDDSGEAVALTTLPAARGMASDRPFAHRYWRRHPDG